MADKKKIVAKKKGGNTVALVTELVEPIVKEVGVDLWDVRFEKEGSSWFLRIIIDKDTGVSIDDCEAVSRPLDKKLDELDPIDQAYYLEVASVGLGRALKKPWHFEKYIGQEIRIRLIRAQDGLKEFEAILDAIDGDEITVTYEDTQMQIAISDTAFVKLNDDKYI